MGTFLKDNWIWIVGPLVVILAGVALLLYMSSNAGDSSGDFIYDLI